MKKSEQKRVPFACTDDCSSEHILHQKHIKEYAPKYKSFHTKEEIPCKYKGFYTDSDIGQSPNENDGSYRMPGFYTFTYLNLNELIRQK